MNTLNSLKKILIIEDEKTLARALGFKLTYSGFEVKTVFNGEEGVALLRQEKFDLVLLDLIMPKMDGFMLLATLKVEKIRVPVMVLTNLSQENDIKRTKEYGVKEFIIKSNTPIATIVERVAKFLK
jgi:two-component system alkaline phosphatase synthesis response regulator PhoP